MQHTAHLHDLIANTRLPEAAGVVDDATALHTAGDMLETDTTSGEAPIRGWLQAREGPATRLRRWHDDFHLMERERQEAEVLEQPAPRG
jgi:hypothetical protein